MSMKEGTPLEASVDEEAPKVPQVKFADEESPNANEEAQAADEEAPDADEEAPGDSDSPLYSDPEESKAPDEGPKAPPLFLTAMMGAKLKTIRKGLGKHEHEAELISPRKDLYREVCSALDTSVLVAFYAGLRHIAREGKLKNPELIMDFPVTISNVIECVHANQKDVMEELGDDRYGIFEAFLDAREKRLEESAFRQGKRYADFEQEQKTGVVHFGDEKSNQELVYAIFLDGIRKRFVVVFRGTTTKIDLRQDLRAYQQVIENPFKEVAGMSSNIRVHFGFHEYLYADERKEQEEVMEDSLRAVEENNEMNADEKKDRREFLKREQRQAILEMDQLQSKIGKDINTKCDLILTQAIQLLEENPGYELYITGHSMGGALAILFGAVAATCDSPSIIKPVTCISFSSPKVGNIHFKRVYEKLEQDGLIRKVRVLNGLDPIPKTPSPGACRFFIYAFCPWSILDAYDHVGIELKLKGNGFKISYTKYHGVLVFLLRELHRTLKGIGYFIYLFFLCRVTKLLQYHTCSLIFERLRDNWLELQDENIPDLYERILSGEDGVLSFKIGVKRSVPTIMKKKEEKVTRRKANVVEKDLKFTVTASMVDDGLAEPLLSDDSYEENVN